MIDPATLAYGYDEEQVPFGPPETPVRRERAAGRRLAAGLCALGALATALVLSGLDLGGGWPALALSFGALAGGAVLGFVCTYRSAGPGTHNDDTFFRGVQNRALLGWALGVAFTGFYVLLYFYEDLLARGWPRLLERPMRLLDPLAELLAGRPADRWFLYGFLYTLAVLVFGLRMLLRHRGNRYQLVRTGSVMACQLLLAFLLPNLLEHFQQPGFYFSYFWPLKREYLFPDTLAGLWRHGGLAQFMAFWAVALALVGVPVLTYLSGKRWYCSWVCGCGGLAETLGDPWRQLSSKTRRAWTVERWLVHGVLVLVVLVTALLWVNSASRGRVLGVASQRFAELYGFWIGAIFSGVVGVGFYPLLGSRVWCRFGCPQAAILGLLQRAFSRFRITANGGQCMSCGNCSTYCEMGIDVRAYAQAGENIVRASCVGCGLCAAVCPRGVLRLENGLPGERFPGAEHPLTVLLRSLERPAVPGYRAWHGPGEQG